MTRAHTTSILDPRARFLFLPELSRANRYAFTSSSYCQDICVRGCACLTLLALRALILRMAKHRRDIVAELMAEHIRMPGFPSLIVTRARAYDWLRSIGYLSTREGVQSADRMCFAQVAQSDEPLTEESYCERMLALMAEAEAARV